MKQLALPLGILAALMVFAFYMSARSKDRIAAHETEAAREALQKAGYDEKKAKLRGICERSIAAAREGRTSIYIAGISDDEREDFFQNCFFLFPDLSD